MENPAIEFQKIFNAYFNQLRKDITTDVISGLLPQLIQALSKDNTNEPVLLKEREVMARYKCSRSFLYQRRVLDNLPVIKVGDSLYFDQKKTSEFFSNYKPNKNK